MKIACCQFQPVWGEPTKSMEIADFLLKNSQPGDFDILILPEMAFSGYVFDNEKEIEPLAEDGETGGTVTWAKKQAQRLRSFVMVGFPQVKKNPTKPRDDYYNSICFVNPSGELVLLYQKHFLYSADEKWALEGPSFLCQEIPGLGRVGFGICMDVNPYQFKAPFSAMEFATFQKKSNPDLILCSMAWLQREDEADLRNPAVEHIQYWVLRLTPLIGSNTKVAICNRIGEERGSKFCGSSCGFKLSSRPELVGYLDKGSQLIVLEF